MSESRSADSVVLASAKVDRLTDNEFFDAHPDWCWPLGALGPWGLIPVYNLHFGVSRQVPI